MPSRKRKRSWSNTPMADCRPTTELYEQIKQAADHDEELEILLKQYQGPCLAYAGRYARSYPHIPVAPEDVVQDLFNGIAGRRSLHRYQVGRAYVLKSLKNCWIDHCRKHRPRALPIDPIVETEAVDAFELARLRRRLKEHLETLRHELHSDPESGALVKAIFEDWVDSMLDRPGRDVVKKGDWGGISGGSLRKKRHDYTTKWVERVCAWLCCDYNVHQLGEMRDALRRTAPEGCSAPVRKRSEEKSEEVATNLTGDDAQEGDDGDDH